MPYTNELCGLCRKLCCEYKTEEPLKKHTTFKIGGSCKILININSSDTLAEILKFLKKQNIRFFVLGKGSNILADDNGFDGVILKISKDFSHIEKTGETEIFCTSGTSLSELCIYAMENSLSGLEFAYGIPGTVGGALFMNAGAYGGELKDVVTSAHYLNEKCEICSAESAEMSLSYRHSVFSENPDWVITDVTFSLNKGDREQIREKMNELMHKRKDKQPLDFPSAGSTFKRPEGYFAGKLIEDAGLRGYRVGDAQVSEKHCGFVVNRGKATCAEVLQLIEEVQKKVKEQFGVQLEPEVRIIR